MVDRGTHDELLARDPGYRELATAYEQETARRAARPQTRRRSRSSRSRHERRHRVAPASALGVLATLRRGIQVSPQLLVGWQVTVLLAVVASIGRVLVPIAVQQTVDTGILAAGGPDVPRVVGARRARRRSGCWSAPSARPT